MFSLEQKLEELQKQHDLLKQKADILEKENNQFKQKLSESNNNSNCEENAQLPEEFWRENVNKKFIKDPDYVKSLIKNKTMTLTDVNSKGETLLLRAACLGAYEIVQFCINAGSDLNVRNYKGKSALDLARDGGFYHVEQLLLFSAMNVNIGNEIKNITDKIHKQTGINENISNELSLIGVQSKELFEKILMELMINIINKKLVFSDNLLNLCWNIVCRDNRDPILSDLWKALSNTCYDIIQNGNQRDWYWLKKCVIPSTIWFRVRHVDNVDDEKSKDCKSYYLYYELLKLVNIEAKNQLNKLRDDLDLLANEYGNDWNKLTKWDIPDEYEQVRQDCIPNGIVSKYTYEQLSENSGALFNSPQFYDYNQYLSQLVLLAQIVDDDFQRSVQQIFGIDRVTNMSKISFIEEKKDYNDDYKFGDGIVKYIRGPIKLIDRARHKAQNDYVNEQYPASSCILDLNRCSLVFNDISTLLRALELFVNKVKYYQSGNIIGVCRDKNGFHTYNIKKTQYADIKLNVVICGKHNNLIGEVQFLLKIMKEYKSKAHNLYSIQRQEESIETSICKTLPLLLNEDRQLYVAGCMGDVKSLCKLMVVNNKQIEDIMKIDKKLHQTILHRICSFGHTKAFLFLKSMLSHNELIKHLLLPNYTDQKPVEYCIRRSNCEIAKYIFDIKEIQQIYNNDNKDAIFRLCYWLFAHNTNTHLIDHIMFVLNISKQILIQMLNHKCKEPIMQYIDGTVAHSYHKLRLINYIIQVNTLNGLKKFVTNIGEKEFIENVLIEDNWNINGFEIAVRNNKINMIEYILSFKQIRDKYMNNNDLIYRLIYFLFVENPNENIINYVLSKLQISNDQISLLMTYKYPSPPIEKYSNTKKTRLYHKYSIMAMIVYNKNAITIMKILLSMIGKKIFIQSIFHKDGWNLNAINRIIETKKINLIKYLMQFIEIKQRCSLNDNELYTIILSINNYFNIDIAKYICNILQLTETRLNKLIQMNKYVDISSITNLLNAK